MGLPGLGAHGRVQGARAGGIQWGPGFLGWGVDTVGSRGPGMGGHGKVQGA